jgi:serine/threonine-protein kinase
VRRIEAFGPYDLLERVSVGSTGEVFRAVARHGRRVVALKRLMPSLSSDADATAMLESEARLTQFLDHPAIARVVDVGAVEGRHFIAYDFVVGRDLRAIQARASTQREGVVPLSVGLFIVGELCKGLSHAHARRDGDDQPLGLIHRDVNPANILVSFEGQVVLADFGIARAQGRSLGTGVGEVRGTLSYLSPEQIAGDALDARTDLYSLGVCLYELATGARLFDGGSIDVMQRIQRGEVPPPRARNERVSGALEQILFKALAKPPKLRYADADQFLGDLSELVRAEGHDTDSNHVAHYVRTLFPEAAAEWAAHGEESLNMADEKGGSDLDVFEGLAKKTARPAMPGLTPPPSVPQRQRTMLGLQMPPSPPAGLPPPSMPRMPPPVAPAAPPSPVAAAPLPPVSAPLPRSGGSVTPLPMPTRPSLGTLPPVMAPPPAAPSLGSSLGFEEPKAPQQAKPAVDMDWDDEEESTHVYDKVMDVLPSAGPRPAAGTPAPNAKVAAAAGLLARSGTAAAPVGKSLPPPPVMAVPPPPAVPATLAVPPRRDEPTAVRPRVSAPTPEPASSRLGVILGGLALAGVVVGAVVFLMPRTGDLKIDVKTSDGGSVDKAEIFIDGQKKCETTPCVVSGLSTGPKAIKVLVPGADAAESIETVEAGNQKAVLVTLKSGAVKTGPDSVASASGATGFKIASAQRDVKVLVDGVDKGSLPIELKDLTPGSHKLKLVAGDRYEPIERTIDVSAGELKDFGTMNLKVLKGQLTLNLETTGAAVTLVREEAGRKVVRAIEAAKWSTPPVRIDGLLASENWQVVATKKGFEDYTQAVVFEDGQAEKTLRIALTEKGKDIAASTPAPTPGPTPTPGPAPTPPSAVSPTPPVAPSGKGTLNMNSIPVSKVVLDGRPLGSTPKVGVSVPAGSHTVTFIHPEKGRKSVTVNVKPGETKTAAVKF